MPDTTAPLLWLLAAASACLGVLISNAPSQHQAAPTYFALPYWQSIAEQYGLQENRHATPSYLAEDCLSVAVRGEGAHQRISYELTCSPRLLLATAAAPNPGGQVTILQALPAELFVDPYELDQLRQVLTGAIHVSLFGPLDLEQPAPACRPTVLGITLNNVSSTAVKRARRSVYARTELPFHTKYPAPVGEGAPGCSADLFHYTPGPTQTVRWPAPQLLLRHAAVADAPSSKEQPAGTPDGQPTAEPGSGSAGESSCQADADGANDAQDRGSCQAAGGEAAAAEEASAEGKQGSSGEAGASGASAGSAEGPRMGAGSWSVMPVSLLTPPSVVLPAGCTLHAQAVSAITLLVALVCSAAIVSAALL
ncbi:hypothetical protein HYH02_002780 [Chlamydomonas schloesseri]|uniref:Uncharacterized protein n=1 Tax=Chlamydomonas schloesseri TaxID=2026947 RepID=A0A836BAC6_9CHLO|nr:hypothetical protein HYH02_002780 [Chlamydomonas schloesseri]|eukprot:KAG2452542.1 hypothetical protein HYH02_002780 [Chlamydomonas schloesseri]